MSDLNAPRSVDLLEVCNRSIDLAGGQRINSLEDRLKKPVLANFILNLSETSSYGITTGAGLPITKR